MTKTTATTTTTTTTATKHIFLGHLVLSGVVHESRVDGRPIVLDHHGVSSDADHVVHLQGKGGITTAVCVRARQSRWSAGPLACKRTRITCDRGGGYHRSWCHSGVSHGERVKQTQQQLQQQQRDTATSSRPASMFFSLSAKGNRARAGGERANEHTPSTKKAGLRQHSSAQFIQYRYLVLVDLAPGLLREEPIGQQSVTPESRHVCAENGVHL